MSSIRISGDTSGYYDLSVPAVAGTNTIELNRVIVADASGNVGIGTTSPATGYRLTVSGTSGVDDIGLAIADTAGKTFGVYSSGSKLFFRDVNAAATRMTIDSSGNVGIGATTNLTSKLTVNAPAASHTTGYQEDIAQFYTTQSSYIGRHYLNMFHDNNNRDGTTDHTVWGMGFGYDGNTRGGIQYDHKGQERLTLWSAYGDIHFKGNSVGATSKRADQADTDIMVLRGNGNVGIGTDNPTAKVQINNAADSRLIIFETGTSPYTSTLELASQAIGTYGATVQYTSSAERLTLENYGRTLSAASYSGSIAFKTKLNNTTPTEVMFIHGFTGNVGIGTTAPQTLLHVEKSSTALYTSSMSGPSSYTPSDADMIQVRNSNNGLNDIYAGIWFETGTGATNTTGSDRSGRIALVVDNDNGYSANFVFQTRGTNAQLSEKMRIDSAGIVTMPYQPAFAAGGNSGGTSYTGDIQVPYPTVTFNTGGHYAAATGLFTAPVNGTYYFSASYLNYPSASSGSVTMWISVNNNNYLTSIPMSRSPLQIQETQSVDGLVLLSAGDNVRVKINGTSTYYTNTGHAHFSGYLLG